MLDALDRLFETIRFVVLDALRVGGPLALPLAAVGFLLVLLVFRNRVVSVAGLLTFLGLTALAITVRALQLGRL